MVLGAGKDKDTAEHAFESLGYNLLAQRYGVKVINAFNRPFDKVDLGEGVELAFNRDALESDFIIDLPVMKTHAQTVVSLGIKNLKGLIDVNSRKTCHNADPERDLHFHVARLDRAMPPILTVIDGTYTAEYGPGFDALVHRSDILAASWDVLAADMAGAALLGHDPAEVPHLVHAARIRGRGLDMSGLEIRGERIEDLARYHNWSFPYNEDDSLPLPLAKKGLQGLAYYKYDNTLCTYCSDANGAVLTAVARAWKGPALGPGGGAHRQEDGAPARGQENHPPGKMHVPAPQGQPPDKRDDPHQGLPPQAGPDRPGPAPGRDQGGPPVFPGDGDPAGDVSEKVRGPARVRGEPLPGGVGASPLRLPLLRPDSPPPPPPACGRSKLPALLNTARPLSLPAADSFS